ncbi:MAG: HDOD domain-containing protein [Candidatus Competibacteraceae bacterium]|nr:MAG: HDOD domain-containing protein [Candidatus Competibacteraceae bacterium]
MTPKSLVRSVHTLFSLPDVVIQINSLIDDPATRISDLAEAVLCDPGLAARLLRLVNSTYYNPPYRVGTVSQAIILLGQHELRNLVLTTVAVNLFKGLPPEQVNMERFWLHSIMCGVAARGLARHCRLRDSERLFIAGLLYGTGKLVFYSQRPDLYREVLQQAGNDERACIAAERRVFGFTYAELGAELLKTWRLPENLYMAVAYHLEPAKALDYRLEAMILHVAVRIVGDLQTDAGDPPSVHVPEQFGPLADLLGLPLESVASLAAEINPQAMEIFGIIRTGLTPAR